MIGDRQRPRDVVGRQPGSTVAHGQPARDPECHGEHQCQTVKALDEGDVVVRRSAEMQPLHLHAEVPGEDLVLLRRQFAERLFQRGERDGAKQILQRGDVSLAVGELPDRVQQSPATDPATAQIGGGVLARVLSHQQSKVQPTD